MYEGLRHSLGKMLGATSDNFQPIAKSPLQDVVARLKAQTRGAHNSGLTTQLKY